MLRRQRTHTLIALSLVTLLAFALRAFGLGRQSLWYDEGVSVFLARMSLAARTAWTANDIQPPLYYNLLHGWIALAGDSEFALRFLSLVFGLLTVPLMYATGRRLSGPLTGLLAAFLAAISPLYLWYSQEARMYTLLTFLGLLSSYLLLRALEEREQGRRRWLWVAYAAANMAAVYTHYFAFFVVAFQAVYLLVWAGPRRAWRRLAEGALAIAAVGLTYLPWLPYVLDRYRVDASFWQGTLKLDEALRKIFIAFATGETVLEPVAAKLLVIYLLIFTIALLIHATRNPQPATRFTFHAPRPLVFLTLYLFLPILLILTLSYRNPKFNARYLMVASPPFLLIIAAGLAALRRWSRESAGWRRAVSLLAALGSGLFILSVSAYADYNAYFDVWFTKPDFRAAARIVRQGLGPGEAIILTSGHMFPVFDYYFPHSGRALIPDMAVLDTSRTLDFGVADDLNRALAGKRGVWVVLWQDEVVDPNGFLPMMLDSHGTLLDTHRLWHVDVLHYALPPGVHFAARPAIQHPLAVTFGNQIELLGYDLEAKTRNTKHETRNPALSEAEGTKHAIPLTLYWQARQPIAADYKLALRLRDETGYYWGTLDRRPAAELYPTMRWQPGQTLFGRYELPVLPGTPPGDYQIEARLYNAGDGQALDVWVDGRPQGQRALLGSVTVGRPAQPPTVEQLRIRQPRRVELGGQIAFLGYELSPERAQPGDTLHVMLFWRALADVGRDYTLHLQLLQGDRLVGEATFPPAGADYPTTRWTAGDVLRGQYDVIVPPGADPGPAQLRAVLMDAAGQPLGRPLPVADVEIEATDRLFTVPPIQHPLSANFDGKIEFLGYAIRNTQHELRLTLYWQALAEMDTSYTVFVHVLNADGQIIAQRDSVPVSGARPTTGWLPGEVIADEYTLTVPPDAPPGQYTIEAGLYDAASPAFERLPVLDAAGQPVDDRVLLGSVRVGE